MFYGPAKPLYSTPRKIIKQRLEKDEHGGVTVETVRLRDRVETLVIKHDDPDFHFLVEYFLKNMVRPKVSN